MLTRLLILCAVGGERAVASGVPGLKLLYLEQVFDDGMAVFRSVSF